MAHLETRLFLIKLVLMYIDTLVVEINTIMVGEKFWV
jgi:hypothetical protein